MLVSQDARLQGGPPLAAKTERHHAGAAMSAWVASLTIAAVIRGASLVSHESAHRCATKGLARELMGGVRTHVR